MHSLFLSTIFPLLTNAATVVSTVTESAAPQPTASDYISDQQFQNDVLAATNFYRAEHGVAAVKWNTTSATFAANWAKSCQFKHSGGPTGENIASGFANASAAVDAWGLERIHYNWNSPGFSEATGHFTQLVWSNTTSIGCARVACNGKNNTPGFFVVCEYFPAGNIVGDSNQFFKDNVKKQVQGKNTDTVESGVNGKGGSVTTTSSGTTPSSTSTSTASSIGTMRIGGLEQRIGVTIGIGVVTVALFEVIL